MYVFFTPESIAFSFFFCFLEDYEQSPSINSDLLSYLILWL